MDREEEDKEMFGTLQTLVDMLETSDAQASGGGETGGDAKNDEEKSVVMDKIMNLVTKMVEEEDGVEKEEDMSTTAVRGDGESSVRGTPKRSPRTELPHYPTPYELWKKSHEKAETTTPNDKVKNLTDEQKKVLTKNVTDRLLRKQREEHFTMMKKQHEKLASELRGLTFVPNLSRTERMNKKLVQSYEPLYKRYNYVTEMANIKRTKMEQETRTAELAECKFEPDRSFTKMKKSPRAVRDNRSVEDRCIQYGEEKEMWAEQRRAIIKRIESESIQFSPQLSEKTNKMMEKKKLDGTYKAPWEDPKRWQGIKKGTKKPEKESFSPTINPRSQKIYDKKAKTGAPGYGGRKKSDWHVRLWSRAKKLNKKRHKEQAKHYDDYVQKLAVPLTITRTCDIPEEYDEMKLTKQEKKDLETKLKQLTDSPGMFCPRRWVNKITWDPKYSFITAQFPSKRAT